MEKLIAMQENLGLGHKGNILITTQERVDKNELPIANDIIDETYAHRIIQAYNNFDDLLTACKKLIKANEYARKISLRDESPRGIVWGDTRSRLDTAKLKAETIIIKIKDDKLYLSCPRCCNIIYESKIYPEVKVGKKIKCQNCGTSFIATPKIANDKDTLYKYQIIQ